MNTTTTGLIFLGIYLIGIPADYIDSRRARVSVGRAAMFAPFWPLIFALQVMIAIIELPRRK